MSWESLERTEGGVESVGRMRGVEKNVCASHFTASFRDFPVTAMTKGTSKTNRTK